MGLAMYIGLCCLGILIINPFLGAKAASCPRGWLQKEGNCYGYFDEKLSWDVAELECQSFGPGCHLTSILSIQESALVSVYIKDKQRSSSNVWMGLRDISGQQRRRWRWADESTFNYKAWMVRQPDNSNKNEHCVEVTLSSSFRLWNDGICTNQNAYICKYQL
ncbi:C-type lectin BpLec-like [Pantherophis guttatus]|uniref:C-type lectin BpLec-like n=1 Tax=Pantherophis guttatus TaxID=94885 RepID=A0A6P9B9E0_PANGU|nr:C-type lectin BpLec-like [Pantherophis guttatus]XP_060546883.1 C-type lectin BpLec-like [Pantherophis guttatus]